MTADQPPYYLQTEFLAGLLLAIMSFVTIVVAVQRIGDGFSLIDDGAYTTGHVVDVIPRHGMSDNGTRRAEVPTIVVEFTSRDGKQHRYAMRNQGSRPWPGFVGQEVRVRYLPSNPAVFEAGPLAAADSGFILLVVSMLGLISGIGLMVMARLGLASGLISISFR